MTETTLARPEANGQPGTLTPAPDLIQLAIERGMDPDALTKLVDLIERRERIAAERAYTEDKLAVEREAPTIIKSKKGGKANYAPLEEINHALTPIYTKHGFSLTFGEGDCPLANWKRTVCDVRHRGGHSVRYHMDLPLDNQDGKQAMNPIQAAVSTGSYAQRVLLCRIFNLTIALTDLDGDKAEEPITADQLAALDALIEQFKATGTKFRFEAFCKVFGGPDCTDPRDFTQAAYAEAVADLKRQMKGGGK